MAADIIVAEGLRYAYRRGRSRKAALDGLDFAVRRGEIFGLLGPNGAGKTTAVRILTTILRPDAGRALVGGRDAARDPLGVRRQIAAVIQESAVETMLSALDNLLLYGTLHGLTRRESRAGAERVIDLLGLGEVLGQRAQSLSGGMKRRLQVAKALMVDTPVLFLDEATTGMDPLAKRRTMEAIRAQAAAGRTVLLTTQILEEAEALCDRMILMDRGRSAAGGKLSDLRALARKMFRIDLAFAGPPEEGVAALRALGPRHLEERDGEVEMVVEGTEDEWIRHMARISERWPLAHLDLRGVGLEEIFIEIYGNDPGRGASAGGAGEGPGRSGA